MRFAELFRGLNEHSVRYVVVGGVATVLHGYVRVTTDADLVIDLSPDEANRAVNALLELGLVPRLPVDPGQFADAAVRESWISERNMQVFSFIDPRDAFHSVDLFVREPFPFADMWQRASNIELEGVAVRVAALDDLLEMKRTAGRERDRIDVAKLEEIRRNGPNRQS